MLGQRVVELEQGLIAIIKVAEKALPFVARRVRQGNEVVNNVHGHRILAAHRNHISRKEILGTREGIDRLNYGLRKISRSLERCRYDRAIQEGTRNLTQS